MCRHVRAVVSLALDALEGAKGVPERETKLNRRIVQATRLRYGLDEDRPRTLREVSAFLQSIKMTWHAWR